MPQLPLHVLALVDFLRFQINVACQSIQDTGSVFSLPSLMILPVRNKSQRSAEYPGGRRGDLCLLSQKECALIGAQLVSLVFRRHFFHGITPQSQSLKASTTSLILAPMYRPSYYSLLHLIKHDNNSHASLTTKAIDFYCYQYPQVGPVAQYPALRRVTVQADGQTIAAQLLMLPGPTLDFASP